MKLSRLLLLIIGLQHLSFERKQTLLITEPQSVTNGDDTVFFDGYSYTKNGEYLYVYENETAHIQLKGYQWSNKYEIVSWKRPDQSNVTLLMYGNINNNKHNIADVNNNNKHQKHNGK